jgi:tetratricopeptide (TPR) repeat protein
LLLLAAANPRVEEYDFLLATCYSRLSRMDEARQRLERVLKLNPISAEAWFSYGNLWVDFDQSDSARTAYQRFIELRHATIQPDYLLGLAYSNRKQWDKAVTAYRTALAVDSTAVDVWYSLGLTYHDKDDLTAAMYAMEKVLQFRPNHPSANNYVGYTWADENKNLNEALKRIQIAVTAEPDNGFYLDSLGWAYFRLGNLDKAIEHLTRAVELSGEDPVVSEHLGDVYKAKNDVENAARYWKLALEKDPTNTELQAKIEQLKE